MNYSHYLLLIISIGAFVSGFSQVSDHSSVITYDASNGLHATEIYGVDQDENGFLWIGTDNGVYRFDGIAFSPLEENDQIFSRLITKVFCRGKRLILFGEHPFAQYIKQGNEIKTFSRRINGNQIVATHRGSMIYAFDMSESELLKIDSSLITIGTVPKGPHSRKIGVWNDTLIMYSLFNEYSKLKGEESNPQKINDREGEKIYQVFKTSIGVGLAVTSHYIYTKLESKWIPVCETPSEFRESEVSHLIEVDEGVIWLAGFAKGIYQFDIAKRSVQSLASDLELENVQITNFYQDRSGNIWISTSGHGLVCVKKSLFHKCNFRDQPIGQNIVTMAIGKHEELYLGTNYGLIKYAYNQAVEPGGEIEIIDSSRYIHSVFIESDKKLVYCFSKNQDEIFRVDSNKDTILGFSSRNAYSLPNSTYLLGSWGRVMVKQVAEIEGMPLKKIKKYQFKGRSSSFLQMEDEVLFLTSKELYRFDINTKELHEIQLPEIDERVFFQDIIHDQGNVVWVGSSNGLYQLELSGNQTSIKKHIKGEYNAIHCIEKDANGAIWLGTDVGLFRCYKDEWKQFTKANGLHRDNITSLAYDSVDNRLWVGTIVGLNYLYLDDLEKATSPSAKLIIDRVILTHDTITDPPEVFSCNYDENNIKLHFAGANFIQPDKISYRYRLSSLNSEWEVSSSNKAEFLALAPGEYTFEVQCKPSLGAWGESTLMHFSIIPPLWQQSKVIVPMVLGILLLSIFLVSKRIQFLKKQAEKERGNLLKICDLEQSALQANMNPHFIFNSLNAIQNFLVKHKDLEGINFVGEFSALVRQNMESARVKTIKLGDEVDNLKRYLNLEAKRLGNKLQFCFEVEECLNLNEVRLPSMIIQPFVENAIRHGIAPLETTGYVNISFRRVGSMLEIVIEDNGVGYLQTQKNKPGNHISRGIELSRTRLQLLSNNNQITIRELEDEFGYVQGTCVKITLFD